MVYVAAAKLPGEFSQQHAFSLFFDPKTAWMRCKSPKTRGCGGFMAA
jgi:hypothetical protein